MVSALTIVGAVLSATIFLYGYLLVFDWRLIWIIEYTDVLKVGLVAVAIVSFIAVSAVGPLRDYVENPSLKKIVVTLIFMTVGFGVVIYLEHDAVDPHYLGAFSGYALFLLILLFGVVTADLVGDGPNIAASRVLIYLALVLTIVFLCGMAVGGLAKDSAGFKRDVYTLRGELREVGLIMLTSRYVVLDTGDHSVVIPVSEVTKIEARPRHRRPSWLDRFF